jgi:flap endonuclease-1
VWPFGELVGVDLGSLVLKQETSFESLAGQRVAIDAYNALYQFLATIRQPDGTPLTDAQGRVTSHLSGLFQRTAHMVANAIRPVFVFDGAPHPLKMATLEHRKQVKQEAQRAYEAALEAGDLETARAKAQQTSTLSREMTQQARDLLDALGIPWVDAPSEGEAQAVAMARSHQVDAVASQDYDSVLFGAPVLVRNLSVGGRRKVAGKRAWTDVSPERIELEASLSALGITRAQLVDVAILMGTDYNPGVTGIGPKTALKLIQQEGSLEAILERAPNEPKGAMWARVRDGAAGIEPLADVRRLFLEPTVKEVEAPTWRRADAAAVRALLVDEFRFASDRVEATLSRFGAAQGQQAQRSLGDF